MKMKIVKEEDEWLEERTVAKPESVEIGSAR